MDALELCYTPATELAQAVRDKQLSPVELIDALIARADKVEPEINAFTDRYLEEAREQAIEAEQR